MASGRGQGHRDDPYPSRCFSETRKLERMDPVVHQPWREDAPLSADALESYERDGFIALKGVFAPDEVEILRAEAARLHAAPHELEPETMVTEPGAGKVRSVFRIHRQSEIFARLGADARLARIAQYILADDVYFHQTRLNYKPGFRGREFYWHSDFETWHVEDGMPRMRALSMSVLLTDNTSLNGPTMFMPGSHRHYISCTGETPDDHYKQSLKKQEYGVPDEDVLAELGAGGVVGPTGVAGMVVIFDCNLMHGSNSNITPTPRSNAFFVYNAVSNKLEAPFGPDRPRPEFVGARNDTETIAPVDGPIAKRAA